MSTQPTQHPPLPQPDSTTIFFWEGCREHKLLIQRCMDCGHYIHTPRLICRFCMSTRLAPSETSGLGHVDTFTQPQQPFEQYFIDHSPYVIAVVELPEQKNLKLVTNIIGCDPSEVQVGMPVEVTFVRVTPEITLPMFRPRQAF